MKGTIYLIRHGMTEANKKKNFQGTMDIPLNEDGIAQARAMAEYFEKVHLDAIYASPLLRAHQTAQALAESKGMSVIDVEDLHEIHFGIWEGVDYDVVQSRWPEDFYNFMNTPSQCHPEGAEWLADVVKRVHQAFENILAKHPDSANIAVVMHGGTGRLLLCDLLGIPFDNMWKLAMGNCSVTKIISLDGKMVLDSFNDHHFLPDSGDFLKSFLALGGKNDG